MTQLIFEINLVLCVTILIIVHCDCNRQGGWGQNYGYGLNYGQDPWRNNGRGWGYQNSNNDYGVDSNVNCPRPVFSDHHGQLTIEKCLNEDKHPACWDSESQIPKDWKVTIVCHNRQHHIRLQHHSICSSSGEWTPLLYKNCDPLFSKHKNNNHITIPNLTINHINQTTKKPNIISFLNSNRPHCSMLKMTLSENFVFSCLYPDSTNLIDDCQHVKSVPSGTVASLKCKPPFYSQHDRHSEWLCEENETWKGDFNQKLKCFYSPDSKNQNHHTTLRPKVIQSHTTPATMMHSPTVETTTSLKPSVTTTSTTTRPSSTKSSTTRAPKSSTTRRAHISTSKAPVVISESSQLTCPPLIPRSAGITLECVSKSISPISKTEEISLNSCNSPQPVGAEAKYSCKRYYESTAGLVTLYRKCKQDGTWTGSSDSFNCVVECGRNNQVFVPLITSGLPSFRGQWPWHTAVFLKETINQKIKWTYICGGTLVSSNAIVLAAHCVCFLQSSRVRNVTSFRFDLGRFDREKPDDIVQTKNVESIHVHPSYSPFGYDSDIAVVILKESVSIGYHVRPICFPQTLNSALEELQLAENSLGTVVGWGYNEKSELAEVLQMAQLKVASQKDCSDGVRGVDTGRLQAKSTTFCAGSNNESASVNVCNGDSGGGMYFPLMNSDFTRWYIQGIVSVGIADDSGRCKPSQYSIFTRVGRYADWMVRVMSEFNAL